ncbi:MAG: DNA-3-methyladenine glycosylase 2 family protein [Phycisphaerales bacterium]
MELTDDQCWAAMQARDPRFDGVFLVGVESTGIYCRCVCPARTPARGHCRFFGGPVPAASAEAAGFRACLRCRPERIVGAEGVPGSAIGSAFDRDHAPASVDATEVLARRAVDRIATGALDHGRGVDQLAARLGCSSRHLRRVMERHLGAGPQEFARTRRLHAARRMVIETAVPLTDVAFAAGYASLRRMQSEFRERLGRPASSLRRGAAKRAGANAGSADDRTPAATLALDVRPPFDWSWLLAFFAAHAAPGVESVDGDRVVRTLAIGAHSGWVSVGPATGSSAARSSSPVSARLSVAVSAGLIPVLPEVYRRARRLVDADARPDRVAGDLADDAILGACVQAAPGTRVPGCLDGFDQAVRTILGQQVSVASAAAVHARVVALAGRPIETPWPELTHVAPAPADIAAATGDALGQAGVVRQRQAALHALAATCLDPDDPLDLDVAGDVPHRLARLESIRGIGPWTGGVIAMRAMAWPDAFPAGDRALVVETGAANIKELSAMAEAWRPWRAVASMHLWRRYLDRTDVISEPAP